MKNFLILPFTVALLCLTGCATTPKVNGADLIGNYKINSALATGTLTLKSDGTYQQNLTPKTGTTCATSGKWKFYNNGGNRVELSNFLSVDNAGGTVTTRFSKTIFNASVESDSDNVDIVINGDTNEFYQRIK